MIFYLLPKNASVRLIFSEEMLREVASFATTRLEKFIRQGTEGDVGGGAR